EAAQLVGAAGDDRRKRGRVGCGGRVVKRDERIDRAARAAACRAAGAGVGDRADWEARAWDRPGREIDESGVGAGEAADRAVGACAGRAGCGRGIDAAEIRPNEAADEVVVAVSGDGAQRRCKLDRAEIYAGKPAEIALAGANDRARRAREEDRAARETGKSAEDAVCPVARDGARGG